MGVDSYKWLPSRLAELYQGWPSQHAAEVPFTPLPRPLAELRLALVTTAGVYVRGLEAPFDQERERREPTWGDPSYRHIPRETPRSGIGASHLHLNNAPLQRDLNVVLALDAAEQASADGLIGDVAETHYSLMGYQLDTSEWENRYVPQLAAELRDEQVDAVLITPT